MNSVSFSGKAVRLSLAVAAISASVLASADTTAVSSFTINSSLTDWNSVKTLNRFDSMLGTLISASYKLSSHVDTSVDFENNSNSSIPNHIVGNVDGKITFSSIGLGTVTGDATTSLFRDLGPLGSDPGASAFADWSQSGTITDPTILAFLTGTSPISITINAQDFSYSTDDNGNGAAYFTTYASAYGEIVYTYRPNPTSAVPGPSAAIAFIGAAAIRRRKARSSK